MGIELRWDGLGELKDGGVQITSAEDERGDMEGGHDVWKRLQADQIDNF